MDADLILRLAAKMLLPAMLLFALYVQFHGDYSPGGGFQAGVIAAAAPILYGLVFGTGPAMRLLPQSVVEALIPLGVLLYLGVGFAGIFTDGAFMDYRHLAHDAVHGQEWGVFLVEAGVFITVSSTMVAIFYAFAGHHRR